MIVRRIAGAAAVAGALLAASSTVHAAPSGPEAMRSLVTEHHDCKKL